MLLNPCLDVVESEAEMAADPEVGDGIVVTFGGASIDERLRNVEQRGDVFDRQVARCEEELKLFRFRWSIFGCHCSRLGTREVKQPT